jgi:Concanavalin A-like lectin/glucanases superfamily
MVIYLVVIILLFYTLYYLSKWLQGPGNGAQDMVIYSSPTDGLPSRTSTTTGAVYKGTVVPQIYPGGEYSVSTWIYVTNWGASGSVGKNKPFLTLSGGGGTYYTLIMYLGQNTNKLGVRLSHDTTSSSSLINVTSLPSIVAGSPTYSDTDGMPMCDIESVDIQRWVNITVVMMGKTVDVYIDGKLSRSSVLPGLFKTDGDIPTLTLGSPDGFGGLIGMTRAANIAYTPDRIYANYQEGPFSGWSLSSLDPTQYSITIQKNNSNVFSTSDLIPH